MRIGNIYPTYVYNTNYVSAKSLNRVQPVPDDALEGKTGYTSSGSENTNPLRPGTSRDFAGIVASQMAMGRMRAARIMKSQPQQSGQSQSMAMQSPALQGQQPTEGNQENTMQMAMLGA